EGQQGARRGHGRNQVGVAGVGGVVVQGGAQRAAADAAAVHEQLAAAQGADARRNARLVEGVDRAPGGAGQGELLDSGGAPEDQERLLGLQDGGVPPAGARQGDPGGPRQRRQRAVLQRFQAQERRPPAGAA